MNKARAAVLAFVAGMTLVLCMGMGYNPGTYPLRYPSPSGTPTPVANGVIATGPALLAGCTFANTGASGQWYIIYDRSAVPGNGNNDRIIAFAYCGTGPATCTANALGPTTPQNGMGIVAAKGLVWANSSTFPNLTAGSADSYAACSYQLNP